MMKARDPFNRLYPEATVGGFSRLDGTVDFYARINALLQPEMVVLDLGAGRGSWFYEDSSEYRRRLRYLRGRVRCVIGADIDAAVLENESVDNCVLIPPDGRLPIETSSVDLVVCDAVFEHILESHLLAAELERIVKPGGWVCARTPNRWSYPAIGARLVPNRFHVIALRFLQPHRQSEDVFPTIFALNSKRQIARAFPDSSWRRITYTVSGEPSYAGRSLLAWRILDLIHRILPRELGTSVVVFLQRADAARSHGVS